MLIDALQGVWKPTFHEEDGRQRDLEVVAQMARLIIVPEQLVDDCLGIWAIVVRDAVAADPRRTRDLVYDAVSGSMPPMPKGNPVMACGVLRAAIQPDWIDIDFAYYSGRYDDIPGLGAYILRCIGKTSSDNQQLDLCIGRPHGSRPERFSSAGDPHRSLTSYVCVARFGKHPSS